MQNECLDPCSELQIHCSKRVLIESIQEVLDWNQEFIPYSLEHMHGNDQARRLDALPCPT